jgi:hypothetical protein
MICIADSSRKMDAVFTIPVVLSILFRRKTVEHRNFVDSDNT